MLGDETICRLILTTMTDNLTRQNSVGDRGASELLTSKDGHAPLLMMRTNASMEGGSTILPQGSVRRRVAEIEDLRGAELKQPPSMYISVTTPLEVWLVPGHVSYKSPMLFYKVPKVLPFDSIIRLPSPSFNPEVASTTIKALKNVGLTY